MEAVVRFCLKDRDVDKQPDERLEEIAQALFPMTIQMTMTQGVKLANGMQQVGLNPDQAAVMAFNFAGAFLNVARQARTQYLDALSKQHATEAQQKIVQGAG